METGIDIAMALEAVLPSCAFGGSVTEGTEACWNTVSWEDSRPKPTWAALVEAHGDLLLSGQLSTIDAKYADDFRRLNSAMTAALLSGGPSMETKLAAIRAEWQNVSNLKSAEIAAILETL